MVQHAGNKGELMGCIKRDVRTCFDLDNAPYSNMVLGEVVNLPGKWSSYPPHHHPQPECYFYRFDKPMGFGAGWGNGEIYETHHNGLAIITDKMHSQVTAPGYSCCYAWGICRAIRGTRPASTTRSTCGCSRTMPTIISGTARAATKLPCF